jgi:hypothetical protein
MNNVNSIIIMLHANAAIMQAVRCKNSACTRCYNYASSKEVLQGLHVFPDDGCACSCIDVVTPRLHAQGQHNNCQSISRLCVSIAKRDRRTILFIHAMILCLYLENKLYIGQNSNIFYVVQVKIAKKETKI